MSFTLNTASLASAIAGTMSIINAVETKLFRGDDLSYFVDILNSVAGYCFVIFASTIDAFSCFRVLMGLHNMLPSMFSLNGLSELSNLSIGFKSIYVLLQQLIKSPVLSVIICSH